VPGAGSGEDSATRARRARRGEWAVWWREIDRVLLVMIFALMGIGALAVAAGSPAAVHAPAMARKGTAICISSTSTPVFRPWG
jgi:cell division protein FtsW